MRAALALDRGDILSARWLLDNGPTRHTGLSRERGRLALKRGDATRAVGDLKTALSAWPDDRESLSTLAEAYEATGDKGAAEGPRAELRTLDALSSQAAAAWAHRKTLGSDQLSSLGAACEKAHRYAQALACYNSVIAANPLDPDAQKGLFRLKSRTAARPVGVVAEPRRAAADLHQGGEGP
jgi:tetratricopeptide (TPR) repeat protein